MHAARVQHRIADEAEMEQIVNFLEVVSLCVRHRKTPLPLLILSSMISQQLAGIRRSNQLTGRFVSTREQLS
jgi:hypothetical protein